ncbi:MAG: ATP-binding cassette domain-containing protein, partial [Lentisphaeraceae bacterium]|nr:ATP-binding cassette domain-containing protein [Lentisphaeraceae bacterium]
MSSSEKPLLSVKNLKVHFPIRGGVFLKQVGNVYAVDGVDLEIKAGETVGLVGESGCGKSTFGKALLKLIKSTDGSIEFEGQNLDSLTKASLRELRKNLQIIFQDPSESLNSRLTIEKILSEPFEIHKIGSRKERKAMVLDLLKKVGLPADSISKYPHEFSGGQKQRIGIARAISMNPKLIVCDEAVSALDVSVQSQIMNLLLDLQEELQLSYLFIAHDLTVVRHISDKVAVMYLGKIVEYTDADSIYENPMHPYTKALISAIPEPDPTKKKKRIILQGDVPSPIDPPSGCSFHTRCPYAIDKCKTETPQLKNYGAGDKEQLVSC